MKNIILSFFLILLFQYSNAQQARQTEEGQWKGPQTLSDLAVAPVALIPFPQKVEWNGEKYRMKQIVTIAYPEMRSLRSAE